MLDKLLRVLNNAINLDIDSIMFKIYFDNEIENFIITSNRIDQLSEGLDTEGQIIGVYSAKTEEINYGQTFTFGGLTVEKIAGEPYNLLDTGQFFNSIKLGVLKDGFVIYGNDIKDGKSLSDRFDTELLGLTQENKNELAEKIIPHLIGEIRKEIFK